MAVAWCTRKLVQHAQPSELSLRLKLLKLRVHLSQLAQHCPAQRDPRTTELVWRAEPTKPNAQGRGARWRMGCAAAHTAFELRVTRLHERLVIVSIDGTATDSATPELEPNLTAAPRIRRRGGREG